MVTTWKQIVWSMLLIVGFGVFLIGVAPSFAQQRPQGDLLGLEYGQASGLPNEVDPRVATARIINIFLGLLGTIAVVLIVYAGFLWMTSAGSEDKVDKAKKILWTSVIGLAIILSAYMITSFVTREAYRAVSGDLYQPVDQPFQ